MVELVEVDGLQLRLLISPHQLRVPFQEVPYPVLAGHPGVGIERVSYKVILCILKCELSNISTGDTHEVSLHALKCIRRDPFLGFL